MLGYKDYKREQLKPYRQNPSFSFIEVKQWIQQLINGNVQPQDIPEEYEFIMSHSWFKELYRLGVVGDLDLSDLSLPNLGIAMREEKPAIVILDSGLTQTIWRDYYC